MPTGGDLKKKSVPTAPACNKGKRCRPYQQGGVQKGDGTVEQLAFPATRERNEKAQKKPRQQYAKKAKIRITQTTSRNGYA